MAAKTRWYLRGWELSAGAIRDVETSDGWENLDPGLGQNLNIPSRGQVFRPKRLAPGKFTLTFWLSGRDETEVVNAWHTVVQAAAPLEATVRVRRVNPNGEVWLCDAELIGTVAPTRIGQQGIRASLSFSIPDGYWFAEQIHVMRSSGGAGLPQDLQMTQLAGSSAPINLLTGVVHGPITNPNIRDITPGGRGHQLTYHGTIPDGGRLNLNARTWEVSGEGFALNRAAITFTGPRYIALDVPLPGATPALRLSGSGGGANTRLEVHGRKVRR